ncbi:hypothetical protein vseg_000999 [Gypsophila vaccaria]
MIGEKWTREEDKLFEEAVVIYSAIQSDDVKWAKIAGRVPGRSLDEVRDHYDDLVYDVDQIDSGRVDPPSYSDDGGLTQWGRLCFGDPNVAAKDGGREKKQFADLERKRGTPWTEEEHRLFLIGLDKYGKGDWRSISRNVVITRTPTQVASHAQKYYLRQNSGKKERKRTSIHDITTVQQNQISPPQRPTLQQMGASAQYGASQQGDSFGFQSF